MAERESKLFDPLDADITLDFTQKEPSHLWKKLPACEEFVGARRSKHTMVAWDNGLYIFGGDNGKRMLNDFLVFHIVDGSWARVVSTGSPPPPRYHHSAVVYGNSMFVFGGYTGDINSNQNLQNKNDLYEFKFLSSQWVDWREHLSQPLPPARSAHGATVYNNKMFIFGGYDGHARLNDMWSIDLSAAEPEWEEVQQCGVSPPTCCNFPLAVVGDQMFMFSGQSGAKMTNHMYAFNFTESRWWRIPTEHLLQGSTLPPQRRYGHVMVPYGHALYIFGGVGDIKDDDDLYCFDVETRTWSVIKPAENSATPTPRLFHSATVWGEYLYIFGGTVDSAGTRSGDMYQLSLVTAPKCTYFRDFAKLMHAEEFCDITFEVSPKRIPIAAHTTIIAARSPFLRERILEKYYATIPEGSTDATPPQSPPLFTPKERIVVELPDAAEDIFKMALYYMYTDHLHPSLEVASIEGMTVNQMLQMMELYKLSLLLETKRLEQLCVQYIQSSVNEENVLYVLRIASELRLSSLKEYCMRSIVRDSSYRQVVMSPAFESLNPDLMVELVRRHETRSRPTSPDITQGRESSIPSSLKDDLRRVLESGVGKPFADVILCIGDTKVYAHKAVLVARCSYFEALFRSFMPEDHKVTITFGKNVPSQSAFQSLLCYIYYASMPATPEDALYIFSAPNFFGFHNNHLQHYCKDLMENSLSSQNVLQMLEIASEIDMQAVKKQCLLLISEDFNAINQQAHFRNLPRPLLLDILDTLASKL